MKSENNDHSLPSGITIRLAHREDDGPDLADLLADAFPGTFDGRTFYKQRPHHRILAFDHNRLVGHVGLDLRAITIAGEAYEIVGLIDLCVATDIRAKSIGTALIHAAEIFGNGCDFSVLFADDHRVYLANGYERITPAYTRWFAIEELQSHSVIERDLGDCFMAKSLSAVPWPKGKIDLLGYLF